MRSTRRRRTPRYWIYLCARASLNKAALRALGITKETPNPPHYRGITVDEITKVKLENGVKVKVIAGSIGDAQGPMDDIVIDPEYFDCTVPADQTFVHRTDSNYTAFIYVIDGVGITSGEAFENGKLVLFDEGEQLTVSAAGETLRFLLVTGKPLNEPVAW